MSIRPPRPAPRRGFVLIGVLIALALAAMIAVQSGQRLADTRQREDEAELLHVGEQYRLAIESYWRQSPGAVRTLPARLEDLVQDPRFVNPRRHLRKLLRDPMPPHAAWGELRQGNAVVGVYSQAPGTPFRQSGFSEAQKGFDNAQRYGDWQFRADLPAPAPSASQPGNTKPPGTSPPPGRSPAPNIFPRGAS